MTTVILADEFVFAQAKALSYLAALRRIKCHKLRGSKSLDCLSQSGLCVKKLADLACQLQRLSPDDRFDFCEQFVDILSSYEEQLVFDVDSKQIISISGKAAKRGKLRAITDSKVAVAVAGGFLNPETLVPKKDCPQGAGTEVCLA